MSNRILLIPGLAVVGICAYYILRAPTMETGPNVSNMDGPVAVAGGPNLATEESVTLRTPVPQDNPVTDLGQQFLDQLTAIYEYEERKSDDFFGPMGVAERIARENASILYPNRYESIMASLSPARAAEVINCLQDRARIPEFEDYLTKPITKASMVWEPMGKYVCEQWLRHGDHDAEEGRSEYLDVMCQKYKVGSFKPPQDLGGIKLSSKVNPQKKEFTEDQEDILLFVLADHHDTIRDLVLKNGLYEAQLAAKSDAVAKGRYEYAPGLQFGSLGQCDHRLKGAISVHVTYSVNGWTVNLVIMSGEYPELDLKLSQLKEAVDLRDSELAAYVASF